MKKIEFDVSGKTQREINSFLRKSLSEGIAEVDLKNVNGQRYIAAGLRGKIKINLDGVGGNDLGVFMDGPEIEVMGNGQDCIGNTMNDGKILIRGDCGDILGYGLRGGKIYIQGNAGYRAGIHMKAYKSFLPVIIVGGKASDYCGEYLAGGIIMVLGLNLKEDESPVGKLLGTGMHGGTIYVRGNVEEWKLGKEVGLQEWDKKDNEIFFVYLKEYCKDFNLDYNKIVGDKFSKYIALSNRPYGKLYAY